MAECSASECSKSQGKEQDAKRARGRPRKRPVVEPFEEEVLIEGAAASLSTCNQLKRLEKPVCSLQIPNNLLLKWHRERAGVPYTACLNKSVSQQALQVRSGSKRVEDNLAKRAGSLQSKYSAASGENRNKIRRGHYTIAICAGELESCGDLMCEIESLEMQVTDIEEVMRSKEQEVAVLQQAMEQLMQEREAENREVMANSGKHIDEVSDRHKRRKLAKFKESATKALWFAETFGLEVESITTRTSNDGQLVIPIGSQQGNHPSVVPALSKAPTDRNCHSNVMQTLYLLERFGVSDEFYHELTQVRLIVWLSAELCIYYCFHFCVQVYPELARSYRVKQARQETGKDIELERVPAPFHGVYRHFKPAVVAALQREVLLALLRFYLLLLCNINSRE